MFDLLLILPIGDRLFETDQRTAIVTAGDTDRDGVPDLLVASRDDHPKRRVWVVSGSDGAFRYELESDDQNFGYCIAPVGDIDGDGSDDFAVGRRSGVSRGRCQAYVDVFSGASGDRIHALLMEGIGGTYGDFVCGGEDLDGDGVPDILVGGSWGSFLYMFSGSSGSMLYAFRAQEFGVDVRAPGSLDPAERRGGSRCDWYIQSAAILPDRDADGLAEIAVVVSDHNDNWGQKRLALLHGPRWSTECSLVPTEFVHEIKNPARSGLGFNLMPIADVTGDGVRDILSSTLNGQASIFDGTNARGWLSIGLNFGYFHGAGRSIGPLGDITGDGIPEFVVGANEYWDDPPDPGWVRVYDGSRGDVLREISFDDNEGFDACGPGDLNGDGVPDLAIFYRLKKRVAVSLGPRFFETLWWEELP